MLSNCFTTAITMSEETKAINLEVATKNNEITTITCENCHAKVNGSFCAQCGQSVESTLRYFWSVVMHLLDDIFSFDSRASRTLWPLLFKPAFLTNEYIKGRRVHYVPPLRLYLFVSIIFFISLNFFAIDGTELLVHEKRMAKPLAQVTAHIEKLEKSLHELPATKNTSQQSDIVRYKAYQKDLSTENSSKVSELTSRIVKLELSSFKQAEPISEKDNKELLELKAQLSKIKSGEITAARSDVFTISNNEDGTLTFDFLSDDNNKRLSEKMKALEKKGQQAFNSDARPLIKQSISKLPQLMFILLPLFAIILKLFYLFSKRLYLEHLTVALHSHSFIFLVILIVNLLDHAQENLMLTMPGFANTFGNLALVLLTWIPCYLFIMQKRVYKQGYIFTFFKFSIISMIYFMLIAITGMVAFIWGLTDI